MKIEEADPRTVKNELIHKFFETDTSTILFRNMDTNRWKAYTVFGLQQSNYKVRITTGEGQKIEEGFSTHMSENALETIISTNIRSMEYQRLLLKSSTWQGANIIGSLVSHNNEQ